MDKKNKTNKNNNKKIEAMKEVINKTIAKESAPRWSKHCPIYGWVKMNYPSKLQPTMIPKYEKDKEQFDKEAVETIFPPINYIYDDTYCPGNKYRLDPNKVNQDIITDSNITI